MKNTYPTHQDDIISKKRIGIETECPFSFYYPDLFEKYLKDK